MPDFSYIVDHDITLTKYFCSTDHCVKTLTGEALQENPLSFYHSDLIKIIKENAGVIYPGSMRTSALLDVKGSFELASFYHALLKLESETGAPLVHFFPGDWGLTDANRSERPILDFQVEVGSSWEEMCAFYNNAQWDEMDGWVNQQQQLKTRATSDLNKIILIYAALAHHTASHVSSGDYKHISKFIDDNENILIALNEFYSANTDMIYKNTQLQLCRYNSRDPTMIKDGVAKVQVLYTIQGTGEHHPNFMSISRILYSKCNDIEEGNSYRKIFDSMYFERRKKDLICFAKRDPWTASKLSSHLQNNTDPRVVAELIFEIDVLETRQETERLLRLLEHVITITPLLLKHLIQDERFSETVKVWVRNYVVALQADEPHAKKIKIDGLDEANLKKCFPSMSTTYSGNNSASSTTIAWQAASNGPSSQELFKFKQAFWGTQDIATLLSGVPYESKEIDTQKDTELLSGEPDYADCEKFGKRDSAKHRLWIFKNPTEIDAPNLMQLIIFCHYSGDYLYVPDSCYRTYKEALELDNGLTAALFGEQEYTVRLLRRAEELFGDRDRNSLRYAKINYNRRQEQNRVGENNKNIDYFSPYNHSISFVFSKQLKLFYPHIEVIGCKITEESLNKLSNKNLNELYKDLLFYQKITELEQSDIILAEENHCCQFSTYQAETADQQQWLEKVQAIVTGDQVALFLDGEAGIGKSHLMIAIVKELLEKNNDDVVALLTPEKLRKNLDLVDHFIRDNRDKKIIWMLDDCNSNSDGLGRAFTRIVNLINTHNNNNTSGDRKNDVLLVTSNLPYHEFVSGIPGLQTSAELLFESKKRTCPKTAAFACKL